MKMIKLFVLFFVMAFGNTAYSQSRVVEDVQVQSKKLKKAVDTKDESAQADSYYNIGETFLMTETSGKAKNITPKQKTSTKN
jgi:hypothetical protein